jgi:hypothetical protein
MKTKRNKPRQRFDLRRREFDGKIIKWETKRLSEYHQVDVVTGVYNSRKEAFA